MTLKFFNIDLHIGVIGDIARQLRDLGYEVTDWTLSAHSWVLGRKRDPVEVINHRNWREIDFDIGDKFYARYRDELDHFDAFIVTHTPVFSLLYERWNKPIIVVASTRYEYPFSGRAELWKQFNEYLASRIDKDLIIPIANNKYDAAYAQLFTKRKWKLIPSVCDYTGMHYNPTREQLLYWSRYKGLLPNSLLVDKDWYQPHKLRRGLNRLPLVPKYRGFKWADIESFRGIVHIPYNASIMSIVEQYTASIPLFFPSFKYMEDLFRKHSDGGVLSELSYNKIVGLGNRSVIDAGEMDPNNYEEYDSMIKWVALSDFYDPENMPYLTYFDSGSDLIEKINTVNCAGVSSKMTRFNIERKRRALDAWNTVAGALK